MDLRQNTAVRIAVGPLQDSDGVPSTAIDVTTLNVQLLQEDDDNTAVNRTSITPTASGGSNDMIHISSDTHGFYDLELTAAQLNFVGRLTVTTWKSGILVCPQSFNIMPQDVYDAKYAGLFDTTAELITALFATSMGTGLGTFAQNIQGVRIATAQAGGASSITLDASASAVNNFYSDHFVHILSGTGAGQTNFGAAYTGASKVLVVRTAWVTQPDNTSVFKII